MNWSRVPAVKAAITFGQGFKIMCRAVFITFPMRCVGYRKCDICKREVSPKEELHTYTIPTMAGDWTNEFCESCWKLWQSNNTEEE